MLSTLVRVLCCIFLLLLAIPNVGSAQETRGEQAQSEKVSAPEQRQLLAEHRQLLLQRKRLEIQERQLDQLQEQVKVLNQLKDQQQKLVTALQGIPGQLQPKSSSEASTFAKWARIFVKWLPALLTGAIAMFLGLLAWNFNQWSTRRTARQDHIRMLMDVDSRLIERPWLWTVYGRQLIANPKEDEQLKQLMNATSNYRKLQEEAMLSSFFNMFEAVYDFHRHLGFDEEKDDFRKGMLDNLQCMKNQREADLQYKQAWERFAIDFFKKDRISCEVFDTQKQFYSESFQAWVARIRDEANSATDASTSSPAGSEEKKK